MSINLGGTWYDFALGGLECLGGHKALNIYSTTGCVAELKRSPARSDDAEAVGETKMIDQNQWEKSFVQTESQKMAYKNRSEFSYMTEIIEKALISGDLQTALSATLSRSGMKDIER